MKYIPILANILLLTILFITGKKLDQKDTKIKELEYEVWSLKLDKRLDSIQNRHVAEFRKKLGLPL